MSDTTTSPGVTRWATQTIDSILGGIRDGRIKRCPHIPDRPAMVHAMALTYARECCPACASVMLADLTETAPTCDRCGVTGRDLYDGMAYGRETCLAHTLCDVCAEAEDRELAANA